MNTLKNAKLKSLKDKLEGQESDKKVSVLTKVKKVISKVTKTKSKK